jgi:hypothetical protein
MQCRHGGTLRKGNGKFEKVEWGANDFMYAREKSCSDRGTWGPKRGQSKPLSFAPLRDNLDFSAATNPILLYRTAYPKDSL